MSKEERFARIVEFFGQKALISESNTILCERCERYERYERYIAHLDILDTGPGGYNRSQSPQHPPGKKTRGRPRRPRVL